MKHNSNKKQNITEIKEYTAVKTNSENSPENGPNNSQKIKYNEYSSNNELNRLDGLNETNTDITNELNEEEEEDVFINKIRKDKYFNGHYWFFLPLWNVLYRIPSLSMLIAWSPMVGATYVGVTRIREYWHSDVDCVAGAIIGVAIAHFFGYRRYYNHIYGIKKNNDVYVDNQ